MDFRHILLIGATGSGKSTFIEQYFNISGLSSSTMDSCTYCPIMIHKKNNNIVLIDTPGIYDSKGKTQEIFDKLQDTCLEIGYINFVLLFCRSPNKIDETIQLMFKQYSEFLGNKEKTINLCFTDLSSEKIESLKNHNFKNYKMINKIYYWNKTNKEQFYIIAKDIESLDNNNIIQKDDMKRVFTLETQIKKLKKDLKELQKEKTIDEKIIKEIKEKLKNTDFQYTISQDKFLCPGIVSGRRCTKTREGCGWLKNYYKKSGKKHNAIKDWEIFDDKVDKITDIQQYITVNTPLYFPEFKDEIGKPLIEMNEYENVEEKIMSLESEEPQFIKIIVNKKRQYDVI